jgi:hypothetical protein
VSSARRREGPYRFIQNRSRTSVVALKSDAAAEKSKDQLSRDLSLDFRLLQQYLQTTEVATLTRSPCNDPEGRTCYKITPVLRHAAIRDACRKWFDHRTW